MIKVRTVSAAAGTPSASSGHQPKASPACIATSRVISGRIVVTICHMAACGSSGPAATTGGRDAAHIPSRTASQRTRRSPPRSAQLAACRRTRVPESAASPPTKPACPPAVHAAVQETSATSLPRRMASESNHGRFRQRAVRVDGCSWLSPWTNICLLPLRTAERPFRFRRQSRRLE